MTGFLQYLGLIAIGTAVLLLPVGIWHYTRRPK